MQKKYIRQIYYGRIIAVITAFCSLVALITLYFGRVHSEGTVTVSIESAYLVYAQLPQVKADADNAIASQRAKGYAGLVNNTESFLCVYTSKPEADMFVLQYNQDGTQVKVKELSAVIIAEAFDSNEKSKLFSEHLTYPIYTIKKINELVIKYKAMTGELADYGLRLIRKDFERQTLKAANFGGNIQELYTRTYNALLSYYPQSITDSALNTLACGLVYEYFAALDFLF